MNKENIRLILRLEDKKQIQNSLIDLINEEK